MNHRFLLASLLLHLSACFLLAGHLQQASKPQLIELTSVQSPVQTQKVRTKKQRQVASVSPIVNQAENPLPATSQDAEKEVIVSQYLSRLWDAIDAHKHYPEVARSRRQTAKIRVAFTLKNDGHFTDVRLAEASPYESLNLAATEIFHELDHFDPIPSEEARSDLQLEVNIYFNIN